MESVVGLPEREGFDGIWVVVDRLLKMTHCIPCYTTVDVPGLAEQVLKAVVCLHQLPLTIVSDRGPQFTSMFWGQICSRLGIVHRLSTVFHSQTDGQTERINASMEQYVSKMYFSHWERLGVSECCRTRIPGW